MEMVTKWVDRIRKRLLSTVLALTMVLGSLAAVPQTVYAVQLNYDTVNVGAINRYDDQSVKDVTITFTWPTDPCSVYLVLLDKKIGNGDSLYYTYCGKWRSYEESLEGIGGVISASGADDPKVIDRKGATVSHTFSFEKGAVDGTKDATFYAYVWTYYSNSYYPDAFVVSIDIKNGVISTSTDYDGNNRQHSHSWEFSANENVITAKCASQSGRPCEYSRNGLTLTVNAADADYTGSAYTGLSIDNEMSGVIDVTRKVTYVGAGDTTYGESSTAPTEPGTYMVKVTVGSGDGAATATDTFTIGKKDVTPALSINNEWTVGGDPALSVSNSGEGTVTYYVKAQGADDTTYTAMTEDDVKALGAGAYTIYAHVDGTATTNEANTDPVDFKVNKQTITPSVTLNGWTRGDANIPSPAVSGNTGDGEVTYYIRGENDADYRTITEAELKDLPAGTYSFKASVAATDNTEAAETDAITFTVGKASIAVNAAITGWTYGDSANAPSIDASSNPGNGEVTYTYYTDAACTQALSGVPTNAGDYYVKATVADTDNYAGGTSAPVKFTIARKKVTATVTAANRDYNGTTNVDVTAKVTEGIVAGDSIEISGLAGSVTDAGASDTAKKVTVDKSNVSITGTGSENYEVVYDIDDPSSAGLTVTIDPMEVTLTWSDTDNVNDQTLYYNAQSQGVDAAVVGALEQDKNSFRIVYADENTETKVVKGGAHRAVEVGEYNAQVADIGNSNYRLAENAQTDIDWKIVYIDADDAVVSGKQGDDNWYVGDVTVAPKDADKYLISTDGKTWQSALTYTEDGEHKVTYYLKEKATGYITAAKTATFQIDQTAPEGDIKANESSVKTALNTITFGKLFKDNVKVTISASDEMSGVASIEYQKVTSVDDYNENGEWTALDLDKNNEGSFNIPAEDKAIIYARITDKAGNVTIINSDGLVIYKESKSGSSHKSHDGGYGDATLYNVSAADGQFLKGAVFALYKSNDAYVGTYTVDENGMIVLKNLAASTYYFKQVKAVDGYAMTYDPIRFSLEDEQILGIKVTSNLIATMSGSAQTVVTVDGAAAAGAADSAATAAQTSAAASTTAGINTGDNSNMVLYGIVAAMAAVMLAAWVVINRRRQNG